MRFIACRLRQRLHVRQDRGYSWIATVHGGGFDRTAVYCMSKYRQRLHYSAVPGGGFVCGLMHVRQGQRRTFPAIFPREDGVGLRGEMRWAVFSSRNCWELATDVQPKLRRNASLATRPVTPTSSILLPTVPTYTS